MKEELHTDLLAELYDTYEDMRSGKLTLTRIYVLMTICGLVVFGLLAVSMLFAIQFGIACVYFVCATLCYLLLRFRRRRFIALHFDWISVITAHALTAIAVAINVYLYGNASGSQIFIFAMVAIFYIITLDKIRKRFWGILLVFFFDLVVFIAISWIDFLIPSSVEDEFFFTTTFIISSLLGLSICVAPVMISKLFSIDAIERLNYLDYQRVNFSNEEFYGCISRRAADYAVAHSDGERFEDLNICLIELIMGERNDLVHRANDFYFSRVLKEFATLLRCYFQNAKFIIRSDANTFVVIFSRPEKEAYQIICNMKKAFDQKIRIENTSVDVCLRIVARNFTVLDTRKRPRELLDCVNEIARAKFDSKVLGREFFCMQSQGERK